MKDLLYLVHRIPYPPNKGDKIRSYNILKRLAQDYRVHLGTFVDNATDWQYTDDVKTYCGDTFFCGLNQTAAKIRSLSGLISGDPLTVPYYKNSQMASWISTVFGKYNIDRAVVFSSSMAQYLDGPKFGHVRRVLDFVDVDSDKWLQYSKKKNWPWNWIYQREGRYLADTENNYANDYDASIFVSESEAELFRQQQPACKEKIHAISNGVDSDYFSPDHNLDTPYLNNNPVLVFTGAMDYWANAESVIWFAESIFPHIRESIPGAEFYIVGSNPIDSVVKLSEREGVTVTGAVPDIRPYILHATASVAPLRIARGIQNKVLEAMAMAKPVLMTPAAAEGIERLPEFDDLLCLTEQSFVAKAVQLLRSITPEHRENTLRQHVVSRYGWGANLEALAHLIEQGHGR